jgi:hypothetical protein
MLIGEDVEDLLFELVGSYMVSVFGSADQVITHLLLLPPISSVLGTVGLWREHKEPFYYKHSHANIMLGVNIMLKLGRVYHQDLILLAL